ncbi:DUF4038 domain-containing protein [Nocardioides guangzhouensis]|uniref:apiosidase-like domain-containing protein n=1 Tax=Nocardioides guangzhouensis TaxID=2497878 RepID=UPI00143853AA|nr:DUF4038 domain-containing protein [Nocardioides guangzhouensis]
MKRFVTRVSRNGRYFVDQRGRPILIKGDSPWALLVNASRSRMDSYLSIRARQGFNTVLVSLLGNTANGGPADSGATYDGVRPFVAGNPARLNDRYWDRVDHFMRKAASLNISVMAYPLDGWAGTDAYNGLGKEWGTTTARRYGVAVGRRMDRHPNVFWAVGGDYFIDGPEDPRFSAVLAGIASVTRRDRPSTIQFQPQDTSLDSRYWARRVRFNFVYSYAVTYAMVQRAYRQTTPGGRHIPALMGETHYEDYPDVTNRYLRSMAAWALTSGSPGEFYGSERVWDRSPTNAALTSPGARQVSAIRRVFARLPGWHRLRPDFSSSFITAGRGTRGSARNEYLPGDRGGTYVTGARTTDGKLAVIYLPDARRPITIAQSKMGPGYTARWVNPVNGKSVATRARARYSRTVPHGDRANDWLLVLRSTRAR